jgi:ubiquinone/menaquinone biosynthesis C-methylase UbiE
VSIDHYAGAAQRWAEGASLVYGPIADQLVATSPHPLSGHTVLDVGAGTGVASAALAMAGAHPVAADLSRPMLAWRATDRPPAVVGDICALPFKDAGADDVVASFVLNHLVHPAAGLRELVRVTRPGGAVLACVFSNASQNDARDAIDRAAQEQGWRVPAWYIELKQTAVPLLGTTEDMERTAAQIPRLADIVVSEHRVDVGVNEPEQLVAYRLGQASFSDWLDQVEPEQRNEIRARLVEAIRPIMRPYRPLVVFLSALVR